MLSYSIPTNAFNIQQWIVSNYVYKVKMKISSIWKYLANYGLPEVSKFYFQSKFMLRRTIKIHHDHQNSALDFISSNQVFKYFIQNGWYIYLFMLMLPTMALHEKKNLSSITLELTNHTFINYDIMILYTIVEPLKSCCAGLLRFCSFM